MNFIKKIVSNLFAAIVLSAIDILVVWLIAEYKQLNQESFFNYIFFSSFVILAIFLMNIRNLFTPNPQFKTGDDAVDYHLANSISSYSKGNTKGDSNYSAIKQIFNFPLIMLLSFMITLGVSIYLAITIT